MTRPTAGAVRTATIAAAIAAASAAVILVIALLVGGAVTEQVIPGLGDAGTATRWGLPFARLAMDLGATLTVGALLAAAFLIPGTTGTTRTARAARTATAAGTAGTATANKTTASPMTSMRRSSGNGARGSGQGSLSPTGLRYLRAASWLAAGWAAAAAVTLVLTLADILGEPIRQVVSGNELSSYIGQLPQGTALMLVVLLAAVIALLARTETTPGGALGLLLLAGIALLPPPLTGHSAADPNHSVAVVGLALHVAAVAPWVGGLAVLCWHAWTGGDQLGVAAARFSRMALWCYLAIGVTGLANAIARLPDPVELVTSGYGRLVLGKIVAFGLLGWFGRWHRVRTLPAVEAGRPRAFARLATVEAAVMAGAMGLAVALGRTEPPAVTTPVSSTKALLGYDMPPPITALRLLTYWRLDFFFAVLVVVLAGGYLAGVLRLRRRGDAWPLGRTVAWFFGLLSIAIAAMSGVATYAPVLFSVHMAQHMVLSMLTPIFLVLGAPVTLALRALRPAAIRGDRGPREWLTVFLHSRAATIIAHPLVATAIFIGSTYALYFGPLFQQAMEAHIGHIAMLLHFLLSGTLFYWVLIGVDPAPHRLPYLGKLLLLFVTMPFHAFFGIAIMNLGVPLANSWYTALARPWGASLVSDQHTGGAIAWGFGEIPTFIVLIAIVFQWFLEDQRLTRRLERKADRAELTKETDELTAYNAYLASLEEHAKQARD